MTTARVATVFVETVAATITKARAASVLVESATVPTIKARTAAVFVEVVVGGPAFKWRMGMGGLT